MNRELACTRKRGWRVLPWVLLLSALAAICLIPGSAVWATPNQSPLRQTIPTLTPTPIPSWTWVGQPGGNPLDYAPSGMPDFDQRQGEWHAPGQAEAWTHSGPVAAADVLWWLDSRREPGHTPPPVSSDGYPLVSSFGSWDDHAALNVVPLVNDLAQRLDTNGVRTGGQHLGTTPSELVTALQDYLVDKGQQSDYAVALLQSPTLERLLGLAARGDGVVLYLGLWEDQGGGAWVYLGGHYAALAGAEPLNRLLAVSDPLRDAFEAGETPLGRTLNHHLYPHAADVHNEAQYVSQDAYHVVSLAVPEGRGAALALDDYPSLEALIGQNSASEFEAYAGYYGGGVIHAKLEYAIALSRSNTLFLPIILRRAR